MSKFLPKGLKRAISYDVNSKAPPVSALKYSKSAVWIDEDGEFHDACETLMHPDTHEEGGLGFTNKKLLEQQRAAVVDIFKELGKNLLMGNINLINMSLPVKMFEPRSYLEKLTDVWVYPRFLSAAAASSDPVDRLRLVVTWFVAGLQHAFQSWRKPFNPILGETWQGVMADGSRIYLEQISHHPPISAFELVGPNGEYVFSGLSQPEVSYGANAIKTTAKGFRRVSFPDGTDIEAIYPFYFMRGILATNMPRADVSGTARFIDRRNLMMCDLVFGRVPDDVLDPLLTRPDSLSGTIYRYQPAPAGSSSASTAVTGRASKGSFSGLASAFKDALPGSLSLTSASKPEVDPEFQDRQPVASCTGNWLSHLDWDGVRYWTLAEEQPEIWAHEPNPLPSDSSFRQDLAILRDLADLKMAQEAKELLENQQRNDARLRKSGSSMPAESSY
eukprot:jgi/Botrbrau1/2823/Bobra.0125s0032.1